MPGPHPHPLLAPLAGQLASSTLLRRGQQLWRHNQQDWAMPLSRSDKLITGLYLILRDYADGSFLPRMDRQQAFDAEIRSADTLPGFSAEQISRLGMRKPFYFDGEMGPLKLFVTLCEQLARCGVRPPARVLELGCGHGWLSELLALMEFQVCGTTIAEYHTRKARQRIQAIEAKGLSPTLQYRSCPMETVDQAVADLPPFDAAIVFDALHHVHDWRQVFAATHACLRPGGWFLICNEPNLLHTFVSYRVALLSRTHEVGLDRRAMLGELRRCGFSRVRILKNRLGLLLRRHWIAAQK